MLDEEKEVFFQRFKRKVTWRPEHEEKIRKIFNTKPSHRLSEIFMEARKTGKKPYWMFDRVWNSLLVQWNQPEFRSKSARNQKNRESEKGGCLHTGGSITIHEHALRMEEFQIVFSQARSEAATCGEEEEISLLDPNEEEKLRKNFGYLLLVAKILRDGIWGWKTE
ncbi:uncharacterized protein LOC114181270 isoform X2 [Vigna unguiculata]|nr:uncharacterized protein LOC114181270 isoform X2 [Vigna unguiculata]